MRRLDRRLSLQQERLAYKRAVKLTLTTFFDKSSAESIALVDGWWKEIGNGPAFTTGLFMHYEPLNVAADLAGASEAPSILEVDERYRQVIEQAMPKSRAKQKKQPASVTERPHAA